MTAQPLWEALERHLDRAVDLRRVLHGEPDLSGDEWQTRDRVLKALPPQAQSPVKVAETGAVVRIGGPGSAVALRGEMDALPVYETTGVEWASQHGGVMHACGHDVHMAAVVAVSWAIAEAGGPAPLLVVLQPREETYPSGAKDIADLHVLEDEQCGAMIGAHVQPSLEPGVVACVPGGVNASSDEFEIVVHGSTGHAAYPHLADDPLLALSQVVITLQSIVSRSVDPMHSAVVGVSSFTSGQAANVVPGTARATGTIRALDPQTRSVLHERIRSIATTVAQAHDCRAEVTITHGEPVLENDPRLVEATSRHLEEQGLTLSTTLRSLGADDFSYFSERLPAVMMFVGTEGRGSLHAPDYLPTDDDVRLTARTMLAGYLGAADLLGADPDGP